MLVVIGVSGLLAWVVWLHFTAQLRAAHQSNALLTAQLVAAEKQTKKYVKLSDEYKARLNGASDNNNDDFKSKKAKAAWLKEAGFCAAVGQLLDANEAEDRLGVHRILRSMCQWFDALDRPNKSMADGQLPKPAPAPAEAGTELEWLNKLCSLEDKRNPGGL
jgi:hypothetical protein